MLQVQIENDCVPSRHTRISQNGFPIEDYWRFRRKLQIDKISVFIGLADVWCQRPGPFERKAARTKTANSSKKRNFHQKAKATKFERRGETCDVLAVDLDFEIGPSSS